MRTRKVGSITCGCMMIVFGILFLVHMFFPALRLTIIMKLWPIILIALGAEMIIANLYRREDGTEVLKYDKGAVFLTILLTFFAMGMGIIQHVVDCWGGYGYIYID